MPATSQRETFAHFDKIAASPKGSVLLVCEPIQANYAGDVFDLTPGTWVRVVHAGEHEMYVKAAIDGEVRDMCIRGRDYSYLEPKT